MSAKKGRREFFEVFRLSPADDNSKPEKIEYQRTAHNENVSGKDTGKDEPEKHKLTSKSSRTTKYEPQKWSTKKESTPDIVTPQKDPDSVSDNTENLKDKFNSLRKEEVKISQETIIIFAVAAVFLSVACFFIGYKVGHNSGVASSTETGAYTNNDSRSGGLNSVRDDDDKVGALNLFNESDRSEISGIKRSSSNLWTLRIISYKSTNANLIKATNLAKAIKNMTGTNSFVAKVGKELIVCVGKFKDDNNQGLIDLQIKMQDLVYENKKQFRGAYPVKLK
ncbi:MAG: hypothetical protein ACUZ8H_12095 [Candidatus Anammoxibacter sp.]